MNMKSENIINPESINSYIYEFILSGFNYIFRFDDRARRHAKNASREGPIPFNELGHTC